MKTGVNNQPVLLLLWKEEEGDTCKMGGKNKMCEDCGIKRANFGTVGEWKVRFCKRC